MDRAPAVGACRQLSASAAHRLTTLSGLAPTTPQALQQDFLKRLKSSRSSPRTAPLPTQDVTEAEFFANPARYHRELRALLTENFQIIG